MNLKPFLILVLIISPLALCTVVIVDPYSDIDYSKINSYPINQDEYVEEFDTCVPTDCQYEDICRYYR